MLGVRSFNGASLGQGRRLEAWRTYLRHHHSRFVASSSAEAGFQAEMTRLSAPNGFVLLRLALSPQRILCDLRQEAGGAWLMQVQSGALTLETERGEIALTQGGLWHGRAPRKATLTAQSQCEIILAFYPRADRGARLEALTQPAVAARLNREAGPAAFLSGLLDVAARRIARISSDEMRPLQIALMEFAVSAVEGASSSESLVEKSGSRNAILMRATQQIEAQLSDVQLSPQSVGDSLEVSVRYIQKAFEDSGENFSGYVRRRRLERAYEDLMDPVMARHSISDIAFRWGFNDSAYFSRCFRDLYGMSPSRHRGAWRWHQETCPKKILERRASRVISLRERAAQGVAGENS